MANGIPPLLNQAANIANTAVLLTADAVVIARTFNPLSNLHWGIFDQSGLPVIIPDSIVSFDFKNEWRISEYPQEQGAFQSYNKVATPFDARITMTKGGSQNDRENFLKTIESISASIDLYNVVTPERTYNSANIQHYDYRRTATNGAGLIVVDLWLLQIRQTAQATFSNTSQAGDKGTVNTGTVQAGSSTTAPSYT